MRNRLNIVIIYVACVVLAFNHAIPVHAGIISTDKFMSQQIVSQDREVLYKTIEREEVQFLLEKHGVSTEQAKQRVNALTEEEVTKLAKKFDELPAAGHIGIVAAVLILVLLLIAMSLAR